MSARGQAADLPRVIVREGLGHVDIELDRPLDPAVERLAIFAGPVDLSDLCISTGVGMRLPRVAYPTLGAAGELTVFLITSEGAWQALTAAAPPAAASPPALPVLGQPAHTRPWRPRVNFGVKAQIDEGHRPDSAAPPRHSYQDVTGAVGVSGATTFGRSRLDAQIDTLGVSRRQEALRYATEFDQANKFDLASYSLHWGSEQYKLSLGHQLNNGHRLLFNQFDSRGITLSAQPISGTEVGVMALSGARIVGFDNIVGLEEDDSRVYGLTLGQELLRDTPGALRVEVSALDASRLPQSNFNQASVTDAEISKGLGLRITAAAFQQRLRMDAGYARSRFDNPSDPLLTQNVTAVDVQRETRSARYMDLSYALLRDRPVTESRHANLVLAVRHQRTDPLYRSIGVYLPSDRVHNQVDLTGSLSAAHMVLSYARGEDNLDDLPSLLKTFTRARTAQLQLPLASLLGDAAEPSPWWPNLGYRMDYTHQRGDSVPVNSGFSASHVPDQRNRIHTLSAEWYAPVFRFAYRVGRATQDNRQVGRERADFINLNHGIALGLIVANRFDAALDIGQDRADSQETSLVSRTKRGQLGWNWRATERYSLNGSVSLDSTRDSRDQAQSDNQTWSVQGNYNLDLKVTAEKAVPVQLFLRYGAQINESVNTVFGINQETRLWTLSAGLNIAVF